MAKDIQRFSFSRLNSFKKCPRQHHYTYIEQVETEESATTIPGSLFHECVELHGKGLDYRKPIEEFAKYCREGKLELEPDTLEIVFTEYQRYYAKEFEEEEILLVETEFTDELEDEDFFIVKIDKVVRDKSGYIIARDTKTTLNKLKYTQDDVTYNQQLHTYVPFIEEYLKEKVDCLEIDEVRIAKLQPVPLLRSGKPSTNKSLLELVTYEAYYDCLCSMGLETEKEFQPILDYLRQRGHPLFRRIRIQILDRNISSMIAQDILDTYKCAKLGYNYRVTGPLCNYCQYKDLCHLDYSCPSELEREILKKNL